LLLVSPRTAQCGASFSPSNPGSAMTAKVSPLLAEFIAPLNGVRVLDLSDGKGELCSRLLADLGADVVLIEPPAGAASRHLPPLVDGESLYFAAHNANRRSVALDLQTPAGREQFLQLADAADILIETQRPGAMAQLGLGVALLHQRNPQLIVLSMSDFGQTGPYRDFV